MIGSQNTTSARVDRTRPLLTIAAIIEGATGIALLLLPNFILWMLLGVTAEEPWLTVARVAGSAMVALAISCWPDRNEPVATKQVAAMLFYNAIVSGVLVYAGLAAAVSGILLWPVVALHFLLSALLARALHRQ